MRPRITFLGFIVSQKYAYHRVWFSTFIPFGTAHRENLSSTYAMNVLKSVINVKIAVYRTDKFNVRKYNISRHAARGYRVMNIIM